MRVTAYDPGRQPDPEPPKRVRLVFTPFRTGTPPGAGMGGAGTGSGSAK